MQIRQMNVNAEFDTFVKKAPEAGVFGYLQPENRFEIK